MTTLTTTEARQNLFEIVKKSIKGHVPIKITSKSGDVVMMSEEDYGGLLETLEILSTPGMMKSIRRAESDIKAGRVKSIRQIFGR